MPKRRRSFTGRRTSASRRPSRRPGRPSATPRSSRSPGTGIEVSMRRPRRKAVRESARARNTRTRANIRTARAYRLSDEARRRSPLLQSSVARKDAAPQRMSPSLLPMATERRDRVGKKKKCADIKKARETKRAVIINSGYGGRNGFTNYRKHQQC